MDNRPKVLRHILNSSYIYIYLYINIYRILTKINVYRDMPNVFDIDASVPCD